eukprot:1161602-Pelagomonas_calceolata.AAC.7
MKEDERPHGKILLAFKGLGRVPGCRPGAVGLPELAQQFYCGVNDQNALVLLSSITVDLLSAVCGCGCGCARACTYALTLSHHALNYIALAPLPHVKLLHYKEA